MRSLAYQHAKVTARAAAKPALLAISGTPMPSVRLSVTSVPNTLIITTVSQYSHGMYFSALNWIDLQSKCNSKNEDERQGQIELTHKIIRT